MDGQTVLTNTTDYAAIVVATVTNKELNKIKAMMKQLRASVTAQEATVAIIYINMSGGSRSTGNTHRQEEGKARLARVRALQVRSVLQGRELFGAGGE